MPAALALDDSYRICLENRLFTLAAVREPIRGDPHSEPEKRTKRNTRRRRAGKSHDSERDKRGEYCREAKTQFDVADSSEATHTQHDHLDRECDPQKQTSKAQFEGYVVVLRLGARAAAFNQGPGFPAEACRRRSGCQALSEGIVPDVAWDLSKIPFAIVDRCRCSLIRSDAGISVEHAFSGGRDEYRGERKRQGTGHQERD